MSENKNKTYSKEELLKLIKDNISLPEGADDFDKEALEGLKLIKDETILEKLNTEVDQLSSEKKKGKKVIYYLSAAASLILVIGLILLFKNEVKTNQEKVVASAELKPKEETIINNEPTTTILEEKQADVKPDANSKRKEKAEQPKISEEIAQQHVALAPIATSKDELDQTISVEKNTAANNEGRVDGVTTNNNIALIDADTKSGGTVDRENSPRSEAKNYSAAPVAALAKSDVAKKEEKVAADEMAKPSSFYANNVEKTKTGNKYTLPAFIGGDSAFVSYAKQHLKISSPNATGKITVAFTVTKNGKAEKIKVLTGISGCEACSNDVIELIKSIKNWQPATINSKPVDYPKTLVIQYN